MHEHLANLFVISAPSGAGKTSLVHALIEELPNISSSVSHTTRDRRPNEVDGVDYHFVDHESFNNMIAADAFLEHAEVFGNLYGTAHNALREILATGTDIVLEIDWQGARNVRLSYPNAVTIFVLPPSRDTLRTRLNHRGLDDEQVIEQRMAAAVSEMSHFSEYEYLVVNDDFKQALTELRAIVTANRLKTRIQAGLLGAKIDGLIA